MAIYFNPGNDFTQRRVLVKKIEENPEENINDNNENPPSSTSTNDNDQLGRVIENSADIILGTINRVLLNRRPLRTLPPLPPATPTTPPVVTSGDAQSTENPSSTNNTNETTNSDKPYPDNFSGKFQNMGELQAYVHKSEVKDYISAQLKITISDSDFGRIAYEVAMKHSNDLSNVTVDSILSELSDAIKGEAVISSFEELSQYVQSDDYKNDILAELSMTEDDFVYFANASLDDFSQKVVEKYKENFNKLTPKEFIQEVITELFTEFENFVTSRNSGRSTRAAAVPGAASCGRTITNEDGTTSTITITGEIKIDDNGNIVQTEKMTTTNNQTGHVEIQMLIMVRDTKGNQLSVSWFTNDTEISRETYTYNDNNTYVVDSWDMDTGVKNSSTTTYEKIEDGEDRIISKEGIENGQAYGEKYNYDENNNLISITRVYDDTNGTHVSLEYAPENLDTPISKTVFDDFGNVLSFSKYDYSDKNCVTETITYSDGSQDEITTYKDQDGDCEITHRDADGNVLWKKSVEIDEGTKNITTEIYEYQNGEVYHSQETIVDKDGNLLQETNTQYKNEGEVQYQEVETTIYNEDGSVKSNYTVETHIDNETNQVISLTYENGELTLMTVVDNETGKLISQTEYQHNATEDVKYNYDEHNNLVSEEHIKADGSTIKIYYDSDYTETVTIDSNGRIVQSRTEHADGTVRTGTFNELGMLVNEITVDANNNKTETSYENGYTQTIRYDANGHLTEKTIVEVDRGTTITTVTKYDNDANAISETITVVNEDGSKVVKEYDSDNNLITYQEYDKNGDLVINQHNPNGINDVQQPSSDDVTNNQNNVSGDNNGDTSTDDIEKILDELGLSETDKWGLFINGSLTIGDMKITLVDGQLNIENINGEDVSQEDIGELLKELGITDTTDIWGDSSETSDSLIFGNLKITFDDDGVHIENINDSNNDNANNNNNINTEPPEPTNHEDSFTLEGEALDDLLRKKKTVTVDGVTYTYNGWNNTYSVSGKSGEYYYDEETNSFKSTDSYDNNINLDPTKFSGYMEQLEQHGFFTTEDGITFIGHKTEDGLWTFTINSPSDNGIKYVLYENEQGNSSLGRVDNNSQGGFKTSDGSYLYFDSNGTPSYKETPIGEMNGVQVFIRTYLDKTGAETSKREYVDENGTRYNSPSIELSDEQMDRLNSRQTVVLDNGTTVENVGGGEYLVNGERCKLAEDGKTFISTENYTVTFTSQNGSVTVQEYKDGKLAETTMKDKNGNIIQIVVLREDGNGPAYVQNYTYDAKGNVTMSNQIEFNQGGQIAVQTVTDQWGGTSTTEYTYDSNGQRTGYTETNIDADGNKGYITYDAKGNIVSAEFDVINNKGEYVHINPKDFGVDDYANPDINKIDHQRVIEFAQANGLSFTYSGTAVTSFITDLNEAIANGSFNDWWAKVQSGQITYNNSSSSGGTGYTNNSGHGNVWAGNVTNYQGGLGYQNIDPYGNGQWVSHNDWTWAPGQAGGLGMGRVSGGGGGGGVYY